MHQLFIHFQGTYNSVIKEVSHKDILEISSPKICTINPTNNEKYPMYKPSPKWYVWGFPDS